MTKNVIVVDELGKEYAPTYAKRARGLVKQGRARWIDENTICLACPPNNLEDNEMDNMEKIGVIENTEVAATEVQPEEAITEPRITAAEVLARMDKIIAQGEELARTIQLIHDIPVNDSPEGGLDGQARANAIRDICIRREVTNQVMLNMLEEMLHPNKANSDMIDKVLNYDFGGVPSDTARVVLSFIERNS